MFLSPEWFGALARALEDAGADEGPLIVLGQVVTGVPFAETGTVAYRVALGGGRPPQLEEGSVEGAEVVLVTPYEDALALARGDRSAAELLAAGKVKIRGDATRLAAGAGLFESAAAAVSRLHGIVT